MALALHNFVVVKITQTINLSCAKSCRSDIGGWAIPPTVLPKKTTTVSKALGRPWGEWQSGNHWVPPLGPVSDLFHVPTVAGGWCLAQNNPEVLTTGPRNLGDRKDTPSCHTVVGWGWQAVLKHWLSWDGARKACPKTNGIVKGWLHVKVICGRWEVGVLHTVCVCIVCCVNDAPVHRCRELLKLS